MTSFHFEVVFSREISAVLSVIATPSTTRRSQPDYRSNDDAIMNCFILHPRLHCTRFVATYYTSM